MTQASTTARQLGTALAVVTSSLFVGLVGCTGNGSVVQETMLPLYVRGRLRDGRGIGVAGIPVHVQVNRIREPRDFAGRYTNSNSCGDFEQAVAIPYLRVVPPHGGRAEEWTRDIGTDRVFVAIATGPDVFDNRPLVLPKDGSVLRDTDAGSFVVTAATLTTTRRFSYSPSDR